MTSIAKRAKHFFSHWFTRYLMATELYMVEPWERIIVHVLFAVLFGLFWFFNSAIVINGISRLRSAPADMEQLL